MPRPVEAPAARSQLQPAAAARRAKDYIADTTTEPWPGTGGSQPNPDARVEADAILMWFGPEDAPVLRLPPIDPTRPTAPPAPGP